jgi:hypothetical protein
MGMCAEVFAIGPFRSELVPHLTHAPERYAATREGALLIERVFWTPEGSSRSRELASCLGVDPWDFRGHAVDATRADVDRLHGMFDSCGQSAWVQRFVALRAAGHRFFFRPNG